MTPRWEAKQTHSINLIQLDTYWAWNIATQTICNQTLLALQDIFLQDILQSAPILLNIYNSFFVWKI